MAQNDNTPARTSISPATYGLPNDPISRAETARNVLAIAAQKCNLLAPETQLDFIRAHYAICLRIVVFPGDECWYQAEKKFALTYASLNKLAAAAGLTFISVRRVDDGKTPLFWRFEARGKVRLFDGTEREEIASRELDLRDGAPETLKSDGKSALQGINKIRSVGAQQCESKAKARVIRALLGIRSYTQEESNRPFVWPALVYMPPDTEDVNRMVAAKELGMVEAMYGQRPASTRAEVIDVPCTPLAIEDKGGNQTLDFQAETERLNNRSSVRREVDNVPDEPFAAGGYDDPPPDDPSWESDRKGFVDALGRASLELEDVEGWLRRHNRKRPSEMTTPDRRALYQELRSYGGNLPQGGAK